MNSASPTFPKPEALKAQGSALFSVGYDTKDTNSIGAPKEEPELKV